jgi:serine/threonine-protein kinase
VPSPDPATPTSGACPPLDTLRSYAAGRLSGQEATLVASHRGRCPRCDGLLRTLAGGGDSVSPSLRRTRPLGPATDPGATKSSEPPPGAGRPPPERLGRYALGRKLGEGGFGAVYLARDEELDRLVAVKLPHAGRLPSSEGVRAYHAEARLHAALDHPNIVPIYDVGRTADVPFYFVSRYVAGHDLAERIRADRPGPRAAAALAAVVAGALEYMHGRGLVHRDVKPRNILLDAEGTPYLADFGLAGHPGAGPGGLAGTPAYMSPEQAAGDGRPLDGRSDLYSLGVILYELLTGARPFDTGGVDGLLRKVRGEEPPPPRRRAPGVPADLEAVCLHAMAKDPDRRYQRAAELREDLECFLRGEPLRHARRAGPARRALSWARRNRTAASLAAAAVAALALCGFLALRPRPDGPPPAPARIAATVDTEPPGADVAYIPLDGRTGVPRPADAVRGRAGDPVGLVPGRYLVVAVLGDRFHEVFRLVPDRGAALPGAFRHEDWKTRDGVVRLHPVVLPPVDVARGMARLPAGKSVLLGSDELSLGEGQKLAVAPPHRRDVPAFFLDTTEVTQDAFRRWEQGLVPEPGAWPPGPAAASVTWDQAVAFAEKAGKRLPDEAEYECAARARGTRRFPWGDDDSPLAGRKWELGPVKTPAFDRLQLDGEPPVFGLYSNVAEWTASWAGAYPGPAPAESATMLRAVRGGPPSVVEGKVELSERPRGPCERFCLVATEARPGLGFRCARSVKPRLAAEDFIAVPGE